MRNGLKIGAYNNGAFLFNSLVSLLWVSLMKCLATGSRMRRKSMPSSFLHSGNGAREDHEPGKQHIDFSEIM